MGCLIDGRERRNLQRFLTIESLRKRHVPHLYLQVLYQKSK